MFSGRHKRKNTSATDKRKSESSSPGRPLKRRKTDDTTDSPPKKRSGSASFFKWDCERVGQFLKDIRMDMYCDVFKKNAVDGEVLRYLNEKTAKDLVKSFHVKKLLARIEKLYEDESMMETQKAVTVQIPVVESDEESDEPPPVKKKSNPSSTAQAFSNPPSAAQTFRSNPTRSKDNRCWEFQNEHQNWIPYPPNVNAALRTMNVFSYSAANGHTYIIDLIRNVQRNSVYKTERPVREVGSARVSHSSSDSSKVCWEWLNEHNQWIAYPEEVNDALRTSSSHVYAAGNGETYRVDLTTMTSTNTTYGTIRTVRQAPQSNQAPNQNFQSASEDEEITVKFRKPNGRTVQVKLTSNCPFGLVLDKLKEQWGKDAVIGKYEGNMVLRKQTPNDLFLEPNDIIDVEFPLD